MFHRGLYSNSDINDDFDQISLKVKQNLNVDFDIKKNSIF